MCGRLNVIGDPLAHWVGDVLGVAFTTQTNRDLRPTQTVDTIATIGSGMSQLATTWGIKPSWAKNLIINAQAETVAGKPTFKQAFSSQRCIVPCTGWYEWRAEGGPGKQQYAFSHADGIPFLMAGIWFDQPTHAEPGDTHYKASGSLCSNSSQDATTDQPGACGTLAEWLSG